MAQTLYFAEIDKWGTCPPLQSKQKGAPGSWFAARKEALRRLSVTHFGVKPLQAGSNVTAESALPQPNNMFRLRPRADHSNYAECEECRVRRVAVEKLVFESARLELINEKRNERLSHVQEMFAEREVVEYLENEAQRSTLTAFCVDDKLGSHWQFLPISANDRASKKTAKNWKYRLCLQGNSYDGLGNFLSVVPPMLGTGANFGCT
eukprot:462877-Pleurochrysis_carterae.AAC.1